MIRQEIAQLDTSASNLRRFGFVVGGVLTLLGGWFLWRGKAVGPWFLAPGCALVLLGAAVPKSLRGVYVVWMSLAFALGLVVSTTLLTGFFYLVVTPVGLAARFFGKDFLDRRFEPGRASYWIPRTACRPAVKKDYEQQF
ncbi:MAG: hypothetical protein HY735_33765 [Verrucomicrobia bacterium]|nr:hypothetical protein [Verrucomicrobiota bacterium]